ncbi:MAG: hypothetical protein ACLGIR_08600 [Actinomycetes bacterium]|jgi:hypothetical protein
MSVLAVTDAERDLWAVLLLVGVVVLLVVVALLHVLLREVRRLDEGAAAVWHAATNVARNTATTWQLGQTAVALESVKEEALRHARLLEDAG